MTNSNKQTQTQLADRVLSGEESLDLLMKKIGWNVRSMMRQADILETTISELDGHTNELKAAETEIDSAVGQDARQYPAAVSKI